MNLQELQNLVARGESETLEFKRTTGEMKEGCQTACAMLNGLGGFVIFGVHDNGTIQGQQVSTRTLEDIVNHIRLKIEPPAFPDIETITLSSGMAAIALRISGGGGPYTYDGRSYVRYGSTTTVMPKERYERSLLERMHATRRWENQPAYGVKVEDLEYAEIVRTVEEAIRRGRLEDPGTRDPLELLTGLGLFHDGQLLNAAVVLFGRVERMLPNYPQCLLRMARFRGSDRTEFVDNRQEVGHAFDLLQRAQRFLRDHLPVAGRIEPNLFERVDDPLYPPDALREALANALCHRDYGIPGGAIAIGIYDDRLEISSTGILPFGLTPEDLKRPHQSRPWNPLIAHVFFRRGIIESWGRGTLKMIELTQRAGLTPPEFECRTGEVIVRFSPTQYVPPTRVDHQLSALQRELLEVLAQGSKSLREILAMLQETTPERTVQDNLKMLRELGLVELTGQRRSAKWSLHNARPGDIGGEPPTETHNLS
jgi:ATP-dependent DNA helicase RecG